MSAWRLAGSLVQLRDEVWGLWPGTTVWTIGDQEHRSRYSDHNENADGVVTAIDVVGKEQAQAVFRHILASRDGRTKYAIHDRKIVSSTVSPWVVRDYDGSNPHTSHTHISVGRGRDGRTVRPDLYDSTATWGLSNVPAQADEEADVEALVKGLQTELNRAGHKGADGATLAVDGVWGPNTQRAFGRSLEATGAGTVGPRGPAGPPGPRGLEGVPGPTPTKITISGDVVASA